MSQMIVFDLNDLGAPEPSEAAPDRRVEGNPSYKTWEQDVVDAGRSRTASGKQRRAPPARSRRDLGVLPCPVGRCRVDRGRRRDATPKAQRSPKGIGQHVDLGGQTASGTPQRLIPHPPFSAGRLLVRPDDGAVDHQIPVVAVLRQGLEDALPHPGLAPTAEATVDGLPLAIALRQVSPVRPRPQTQRQPFTNSRLSAPVRPGSPALPESSGAILTHCASLNS